MCQVPGSRFLTPCLHFTTGCTTGWVNYANERSQAALERSSQDAYDVIRLTRSKAAVWTVDDVARLIKFKKEFLFICLFFTLGSMRPVSVHVARSLGHWGLC